VELLVVGPPASCCPGSLGVLLQLVPLLLHVERVEHQVGRLLGQVVARPTLDDLVVALGRFDEVVVLVVDEGGLELDGRQVLVLRVGDA
jgi:hypothetical protein